MVCPNPMDVTHATYSPSAPPSGVDNWFVGMTTTYECMAGYQLVGVEHKQVTISCERGGIWSPDTNTFSCTNINECEIPDTCDTNARCEDTPGSVNCYCNTGYEGNGFQCRRKFKGANYKFSYTLCVN